MSSKGVDTLLELRRQLQEKRATLVRQVEEEQRRVERLEQESAQVNCNNINTRDRVRDAVKTRLVFRALDKI